MVEANTPEPSIEEILASIRKIISDEDEPQAEGALDPPKPEPVKAPVKEPAKMSEELEAWPESNEEEEEEEILELTEVAAPEAPAAPVPESHHEPEPVPAPAPVILPVIHRDPSQDDGGIVSDRAMAAATGAFAKLSHVDEPADISHDGRTVEDITRELLKPMLRQWIDQNLPPLVERLVEKELRKISRKAEDL